MRLEARLATVSVLVPPRAVTVVPTPLFPMVLVELAVATPRLFVALLMLVVLAALPIVTAPVLVPVLMLVALLMLALMLAVPVILEPPLMLAPPLILTPPLMLAPPLRAEVPVTASAPVETVSLIRFCAKAWLYEPIRPMPSTRVASLKWVRFMGLLSWLKWSGSPCPYKTNSFLIDTQPLPAGSRKTLVVTPPSSTVISFFNGPRRLKLANCAVATASHRSGQYITAS